MGLIKIKKGLNIPLSGAPEQAVHEGKNVKQVALLGQDYVGMKPTMEVAVGDTVKTGQVLFSDKKMPAVKYTAPGTGVISAIHRGDKRALIAVVIQLQGDEQLPFAAHDATALARLGREKVRQQLIDSGLWTALRARPYGRVANPDVLPHAIFVNAMDTNPLAPDMAVILRGREKDFQDGLTALTHLTEGRVYVCTAPETGVNVSGERISLETFAGPHPAGLSGTHIHFLDPVDRHKTVWHIGLQDVIAIGRLFTTGRLDVERIVSLAGPSVKNPRLLRTRLGADLTTLVDGELTDGQHRLVSGSVLTGHMAGPLNSFLGRYHQQITMLREGGERRFLGWLSLGFDLYSIKNIVASKLFRGKKFAFTTALHGGHRAIVPIGSYEAVMPLDLLATPLLRALAINDVEEAEKLGCLELVEEDLALCTYVCPSKIDHGENLRNTLTLMEKEG